MNKIARAAKATELLKSNLAFFNKEFPSIYKLIKDHNFEHLTVNIDGTTGNVDLYDGKTSLYDGDADSFIDKEINNFKEAFSCGKKIITTHPPQKGKVSFHRYFTNRLTSLINSATYKVDQSNQYALPDFYPLILFLGTGVGLHIEKFLNHNNVLNAIIFEPVPERFYCSLYVVDWKAIFSQQIKKGNKLNIILAASNNTEVEVSSNTLWNELINYCPSFPLMTLFYNHLNREEFEPIVKNITNDMHYYLNQWGYYDDEINQINNAFHNIGQKIPPLTNLTPPEYDNVFIVAGGPSLDSRIEDIIKYKDSSLIISCGSSVHPILKHGIIPDFHVEIESHMLTHESLSRITNQEFFEKTILIGALQLPPNVFNLFKNSCYFIKDSTALAKLFSDNPDEVITLATPTCTNTGLAIATHLRYENIYLFGTDFGFSDKEKHHSKDSIYFSSENSEIMDYEVSQSLKDLVEVESVTGEAFYSIGMYCTSKKSIENCIIDRSRKYNFNIRNCADGAVIAGAKHISKEGFNKEIKINKEIQNNFLKIDISDSCISDELLRSKILELGSSIKTMTRELSIYLTQLDSKSMESLFRVCHDINRHLLTNTRPRFGSLIFIIRGSIWHLLNTGTSIALSIEDNNEREEFINNWKNTCSSFLKNVSSHYHEITNKEYPDLEDPWVQEEITGNEHKFSE